MVLLLLREFVLFLILFWLVLYVLLWFCFFFFQAEDGIRDLVRSRGLGDVYKRQALEMATLGGAGCLGREGELGVLAPGAVADLAVWKLSLIHI